MSGPTKTDAARLLTLSEQEVVRLTHYPAIAGLSRRELQALARHLREARYRARDIARQQRREMRGKAEPRGATPARAKPAGCRRLSSRPGPARRSNSMMLGTLAAMQPS